MAMVKCAICGGENWNRYVSKFNMNLCRKCRYQFEKYGGIKDRLTNTPNEIYEYNNHCEIVLYSKDGKEKGRALIDKDDLIIVKQYKWCLSGRGYVISNKDGKIIRLHKLIYGEEHDIVDHINRNKLDNRKHNLRSANKSQNSINVDLQSNNTSGVTGVSFDRKRNKWVAQIKVNYKNINLGRFDKKEDAIKSRLDAEIKYFGDFSPNINKEVG